MSTVTLNVDPDRYGKTGWYEGGRDRVIVIPGAANERNGYGFVSPEGESRRVSGGPILPGPHLYAYGLATVIDNFGGTGAEMRRLEAEGGVTTLTEGDTVEVMGHTFVLRMERRFPKFDLFD